MGSLKNKQCNLHHKIQFISNRVRCSNCNSNSDDAIFVAGEDLRFRSSFIRPNRPKPIFIRIAGHIKKMGINRTQNLESVDVLTRVCLWCGNSRNVSVPNI